MGLLKGAVLASLIAVAAIRPAQSASVQMDGAGLVDVCTRAVESWVDFSNGYAQAVVDSIRASDGICIPDGTTRTEIVTVIIDKWVPLQLCRKRTPTTRFGSCCGRNIPASIPCAASLKRERLGNYLGPSQLKAVRNLSRYRC